jgi:ADP-ribose pyrophosphatase
MSHITDRKTVFTTPWFEVIAKSVAGENPDDPYYTLKLDDYVSIVALTEEDEILLVRQYRPTTESYTLELPSGHVDAGEPPVQAVARELLEETGYEAGEVELIGCLVPDVGRLANHLWCYFAADVRPSQMDLAIEEGIELVVCSREELVEHITEGYLAHALDLSVILLAILKGRLSVDLPRTGKDILELGVRKTVLNRTKGVR